LSIIATSVGATVGAGAAVGAGAGVAVGGGADVGAGAVVATGDVIDVATGAIVAAGAVVDVGACVLVWGVGVLVLTLEGVKLESVGGAVSDPIQAALTNSADRSVRAISGARLLINN